MNPNPTLPYNRAHDEARRLARRHALDLHWAKERRREQERRIAEARALLARGPVVAAARPLVISAVLLVVVVAAAVWLPVTGILGPGEALLPWAAAAVSAVVVGGLAVALSRLHRTRSEARALLASTQPRLAHTQFHIDESVHSFIDSRVLVEATR